MKRFCLLAAALLALAPALPAADTAEEQQLIGVLQSARPPQEKDAACLRLKWIGTEKSVAALAALLTDDQLSHSARLALESMAADQAGEALITALSKTSGATRIGIIHSLAVRREKKAVAPLAALLTDNDASLASTAAVALGRISGAEAISALRKAYKKSAGAARLAIADGLLQCASRLVGTGGQATAFEVCAELYQSDLADYARMGAYRGMILSAGNRSVALATAAITGPPSPGQTAALQLVREIQDPKATKAFADLLTRVGPPTQVALVEALSQRGDTSAVPAVAALAGSPASEVRLAVLNALGILGDSGTAPLLAESAASATGEEQAAARQSLVNLNRGNVSEALLALLATGQPRVQAEAARALGDRGDTAAVPKLIETARNGAGSAVKSALQALALLAAPPHLDALVQLVVEAKEESTRTQAAETLNTAFQTIRTRQGKVDASPLLQGLATKSAEARAALLPVCSGLADPAIRTALRAAVADADARIRAAAIRALCDTQDAELLPDLVTVATTAPEENFRTLAIGGCVRLVGQEEGAGLPAPRRVEPLKAILATPLKTDQKRLVLAGLGEIPDLQALVLVEPMLGDPSVKAEAARAVVKIAPAVGDAGVSIAALKKAVTTATDAPTRQEADKALKQVEARADYITAWKVAGPFRQADKDYAALFDIAFAPEKAGDRDAKWESLPAGTDPARPWAMDLLKALGGEQAVGYARTWVYSEIQQPAVLELGSDDGVKVWLNEKLVYANNTARPLQPGSDKAGMTLNAGWNALLLKVTQNNLGWEFCGRFQKPDGSRLSGLKFDADYEPGR
jgi:HEAT repeat protein